MKKFLLSLALVLGLSSAASAVVIPGEGEAWNTYSWTESKDDADKVIKYETTAQGYTLTLDKGTSTTDLAQANPASINQIRVYQGSSFTITGSTAFTKVTVTVASGSKATSAAASEGWTLELEGEVSTSANSTFSFVSATPQTTITFYGTDADGTSAKALRFNALEILAEGETPVDPDPVDPVDISNTAETAYTTSQAFELITAGQGLDTEVYVKGAIKEISEINTSYGNATYTLTDGTSDLVVFRGLYIDGEKFTAENQIAVGQELIILGKLVNYNGTYEVTTGSKIISINGDAPVDPDPEEPGEYTSLELLDPTDSASPITAGGITIEGELPEGLSYIWTWKTYKNSSYLYASAYVNNVAYAATSYAWTPAFTPVNGTVVTAEFEHAYKFESNAASLWKFVVREEGSSDITELTIPEWGTGSDWTFVSSGTIDLSAFEGKKIQVGFKYVSSTESAGTWEIRSLVLSTDGDFDVEIPEEQDVVVDNIAAALALCTTEGTANVVINNPVTVVYQNGRYLWVSDATGNILLYGDIDDIYVDGDVIPAGIKGTAINYSQGQFQLKDLEPESFLEATAGEPVAPIQIAVEELSADLVNQYVVVTGATVAAADKDNTFTVTDETGSCTLFNQFWNEAYYDVVDVPEGSDITVYAMVNVYKGAAQLYPVRFNGGVERVAAPEFSIEGGQVLKGTQVALTSATEGATIHYTIDGTEPTSTSTVYSEPIILVFDVTIKAIAVKEGMADSDVNEATFTVVEPIEGNEAYFPFATVDPSNYGFDMTDHTDYTKSQTISVVDQPISVAPVTITIAKGASSAGGAFYRPQDAEDRECFWTLRFYKKAIMTLSAMSGYQITSIAFEFEDAAKHGGYLAKCDFSAGEYNAETGVWTGTAESLAIDGLNNDGGTVSFKSITVTFEETGSSLDIEADQDAPVEYYNLQGVRINGELTPGLYIRRQGNATSKVIIR